MNEENLGTRISDLIVGAIVGVFVLYICWLILPWRVFKWACAGLLLYEGWTLIDHWANNTLSESVARLDKKQPLIRLIAGIAIGWGFGLHLIDPLSTCIGILTGHFFFSMKVKSEEVEEKRVEIAAATGVVPLEGAKNASVD